MLRPLRTLALLLLPLCLTGPAAAEGGNPKVLMQTSMGDITLELYPDKAPKTVANFLQYAKDGFYEGTVFHRVIDGFMIQGGGMGPDMQRKPNRAPVENEADNGLRNKVGTIAMARTSDPHSATSQFFINVADNTPLDFREKTPQAWGYTVFGKVVAGMDTVGKIKSVPTGVKAGHKDVPNETVVIHKVSIIEAKQ